SPYLRVLTQKLSEEWGQQVIIDYRAGANGIIGVQQVAAAKPDGYTLFASYASLLAINPHVYKSLPYDALHDFAPIAQIVAANMGLFVHPNLPVRSVKELVALAKARPGDLMFGSNGVGNMTHLAGELFAMEAGVKLLHVPYKGSAPALQDLMGGQVQMLIANTTTYQPHVESGRLRLLAICSEKRSPLLPGTPTMVESGYPRMVMTAWGGLLAPAGTPRDIIMKIYREIAKAMQVSEVRDRVISFGNDIKVTTPEEFAAFIKSDLDRWGPVVKRAGIEHTQ
ncbi:MAG TPA: tripartite tricarboxylate transporter substrate binding protein, partial [Burkholderiales bacterium]|nr:tripartite tricarboxylate transporter substrate binding protein [Burkholderiales bacterium]